MVEIRYKKYVTFLVTFFIILIPIFTLVVALYDFFKVGKFSIPFNILFYAILMLFVASVLQLSFFPNFRITLDNYGITKKQLVNIGLLTIWNKEYKFAWNEISSFDYWGWGFVWGFVAIARKNNNKFLAAVYNGILTNKNEAIRYTVEHLPSYKIGTDAKKYLRKKMPDIKL